MYRMGGQQDEICSENAEIKITGQGINPIIAWMLKDTSRYSKAYYSQEDDASVTTGNSA